MEVKVSWESLGGVEVEVNDADDRWDAVVKASKILGIDGKIPMQVLFDTASVKKKMVRKERIWRVED